jgi:hypothetical protein
MLMCKSRGLFLQNALFMKPLKDLISKLGNNNNEYLEYEA